MCLLSGRVTRERKAENKERRWSVGQRGGVRLLKTQDIDNGELEWM